jgi:ABC-2 type transport system ATP-binding protein
MDLAVSTRRLTKSFGTHTALDGLDLEVPTGEVFGFLGPNGAGKSTTIRLLLDLIRPSGGSAVVLGLDPRRDGVRLRARIGYLPGDLNLPERLSGREFLGDQAALRHRDLRSRCDGLADRLGADLERPMGHLSLGNRRKIGMIAAFMHDPELLVLDEPTGGLDPLVQQTFRALAREAADDGRTVFLSSHVLDEVQHVADRVAVLRDGRLVTEERVDDLLSHVSRTFTLTFDDSEGARIAARTLADVPGVVDVGPGDSGREVVATVEGNAGSLVRAVAGPGLVDLHSAEPDLEDVFLRYYAAAPAVER